MKGVQQLWSDIVQTQLIYLIVMKQQCESPMHTPSTTLQEPIPIRGPLQPCSSGVEGVQMCTPKETIAHLLRVSAGLAEELTYQLQLNKFLLAGLYSAEQGSRRGEPGVGTGFQFMPQLEHQEEESEGEGCTKKKRTMNDTKNISKNFGKAVITFVQKNQQKVGEILKTHEVDITEFMHKLKEKKKTLISIKELRSLWLEQDFEYAKPFREISCLFLRKASFKYIFGSRVVDYAGHLKYRKRMLDALRCPHEFVSIKQ